MLGKPITQNEEWIEPSAAGLSAVFHNRNVTDPVMIALKEDEVGAPRNLILINFQLTNQWTGVLLLHSCGHLRPETAFGKTLRQPGEAAGGGHRRLLDAQPNNLFV